MHGIIYERAAKRGEETDASAPAIYPTHVDKISEALMKEGSDHSAIVNITQLTTLMMMMSFICSCRNKIYDPSSILAPRFSFFAS